MKYLKVAKIYNF